MPDREEFHPTTPVVGKDVKRSVEDENEILLGDAEVSDDETSEDLQTITADDVGDLADLGLE